MGTFVGVLGVLSALGWPVLFIGLAEVRNPLRKPWRAVLANQAWFLPVLGAIAALVLLSDLLANAPTLVLAVDTVKVLAVVWLRVRVALGWPQLRHGERGRRP